MHKFNIATSNAVYGTAAAILIFVTFIFTGAAFAAGITIGPGANVTLSGAPSLTTFNITNSGTLSAGAGTINLKGDWTGSGIFNSGTSAFNVAGTGTSNINNTNTFYNFSCVTPAKSITFTAGATQNISNNLTFTGTSGNLVTLRSSVAGTTWKINTLGTATVSFVDVEDSQNVNVATISPTDTRDSGNNPGWIFGSLAFTSAVQTLIANTESSQFTFNVNYNNNNSAQRDINVSLASNSSGNYHFRATSGGPSVTFATVPNGSTSGGFYYIDDTTGTPTITISTTGYNSASQQMTVAIISFTLTASSPQVAGSDFTLVIKAQDQLGNTYTGYSGTADLIPNYVSPATGSGALGVTSTSAFINGVATLANQNFSDCGTVTITATDHTRSSITGISSNIDFRPFDFAVVPSALDTLPSGDTAGRHIVGKPFTLGVTARNAAGNTCPNYTGNASLSIDYVSPGANQGGSLTTSTLDSTKWSGGVAAITDQAYNKWGTITITAADSTLATQKGTSGKIFFNPKDFSVSLSAPPPNRTFYYTNEDFSAAISPRDYNGSIVSNYLGAVAFQGTGLDLPANYTFLGSDSGSHTFNNVSGPSATQTALSVNDVTYSSVSGTSPAITIKDATIKVISTSGPSGPINVQVQVLDSNGNIITSDNSTKFKVTITGFIKDGSASSKATTEEVAVFNGVGNFIITDAQAETVTVTVSSSPKLTPVSGTVRFGTISGAGVGVQYWRELPAGAAGETEEERE